MANVFIELVEKAKRLPAAYEQMGSHISTFTQDDGTAFDAWRLVLLGHTEHGSTGDEWLSRSEVVVDRQGTLWHVIDQSGIDGLGPNANHWHSLTRSRVSADQLMGWSSGGDKSAFTSVKVAIERML